MLATTMLETFSRCFHVEEAQILVDTASTCGGQADQTIQLCRRATDQGITLITATRSVREDLQNLTSSKLLDASVFAKVRTFVEKNQTKDAVEATNGMDTLVHQILEQATAMDQSLTAGTDRLPNNLKDPYGDIDENNTEIGKTKDRSTAAAHPQQQNSLGVGDNVDEMELDRLLDVDADLFELEETYSTTRGSNCGGLNLLSASTTGRAVMDGTFSKGERCQVLLQKMLELCRAVANIMTSLMTENCCTRWHTLASNVVSLFRARHLIRLLRRVAQVTLQLLAAIGRVIKLIWSRIQGFLDDFDAAKKIGRLANGVKKSAGKVVSGLMSNLR